METTTVALVELAQKIATENAASINYDLVFDGTANAVDGFAVMTDEEHIALCQDARALVLALVALSTARQTVAAQREAQRLVAKFDKELATR